MLFGKAVLTVFDFKKSKTVQLEVKDYATCEFTWNDSKSRIMLHVNSRGTTFAHQRTPD